MESVIYLIRHGESLFNSQKRHQGWSKRNPLTKLGISQANLASYIVNDLEINLIYSSPLLRARQTAQILTEKNKIPILLSKLLLDFRRSKSHEGLTVAEYTKLDDYKIWIKHSTVDYEFKLSDGESRKEFDNRVIKFANKLVQISKYKKILVVAHTDVIWQLIFYFTKNKLDKSKMKNCELYKINIETQTLDQT